jgi:hypothetical protein
MTLPESFGLLDLSGRSFKPGETGIKSEEHSNDSLRPELVGRIQSARHRALRQTLLTIRMMPASGLNATVRLAFSRSPFVRRREGAEKSRTGIAEPLLDWMVPVLASQGWVDFAAVFENLEENGILYQGLTIPNSLWNMWQCRNGFLWAASFGGMQSVGGKFIRFRSAVGPAIAHQNLSLPFHFG